MKSILAVMVVALGLLSAVVPATARSGYDPNRTDDARRHWVDKVFEPIGGGQ